MLTRNSETNTQTHQLFEAELTAPVSGEWSDNDRKLELPIANCGDLFLHRPIVQLDMHVWRGLLVISKKPGHYPRGNEGKIPDVQLGLALAADRARFQHCVVGVFQNGTRLIEKARPASVKRTALGVRSSNGTPTSSSRSRICRLNEGCATCNFCVAAREKFSISATATK